MSAVQICNDIFVYKIKNN